MSEILRTTEDVGASGTGTIDGDYLSHSISGPFLDPLNSPFLVSGGGSTVTVTYIPDPLLFPLQFVEYVNAERNVVRVDGNDAWNNVPPPSISKHISKMREDTKDLQTWTLVVQGEKTIPGDPDPDAEPDAEPPPSTVVPVSASFTIVILANYNISKALLSAAVAARS